MAEEGLGISPFAPEELNERALILPQGSVYCLWFVTFDPHEYFL